MGEIDLLSARDAVEKALSVGSIVLRSAAPERISVTAGAEVRSRLPGRRRAGTRRHRFPGHSQGELFSVHDVTSRAYSWREQIRAEAGRPVLRSNEY